MEPKQNLVKYGLSCTVKNHNKLYFLIKMITGYFEILLTFYLQMRLSFATLLQYINYLYRSLNIDLFNFKQ